MKRKIDFFYIALILFLITSCNLKNNDNNIDDSLRNKYLIEQGNIKEEKNYEKNENDEESENTNTGCKFEDGNYNATVDYNNSETGFSNTYTLDVEVQDCQIVQINFPNDGYLDEDHISYADIDDDGRASVYGEGGKTYEIQIDN